MVAMLCASLLFSCTSQIDSFPEPNPVEEIYAPNTPPLKGIFQNGNEVPPWFSQYGQEYANNNLFKPGSVMEFLPIPRQTPHPSAIDTARYYYPGSIGPVLIVADVISEEVNNILPSCIYGCLTKSGLPLNAETIAEGITMHASANYTYLGFNIAHKNPVVANCTNPIFQNASGYGDCFSNHYNLYLAWDLKTDSDRFIEVGTYMATFTFYWQIEYIDETGVLRTRKFNECEFTDTFEMRKE
jgi:hypothetical protein